MLLNKIMTVLCVIMLLIFGGMTLADRFPSAAQNTQELTAENDKTDKTEQDERETEDEVVEDTVPDDETEEQNEEDTEEEQTEEVTEEDNFVSLFRNNAPEFYYYTCLDDDGKILYNMFVDTAVHTGVEDYSASGKLVMDTGSDEFRILFRKARQAVSLDHPELFWFFAQGESVFEYTRYSNPTASGKYRIEMKLEKQFENCEEMMTEFNTAVDEFLADIDRTQRPEQIALAIHDKILDLVQYDHDTLKKIKNGGLFRSAYGALVKNDSGKPHMAVCAGYADAYVYLLQQCGITAVTISGRAGGEELGKHAWNCIRLDGEWYEVDPTWDDVDPLETFSEHSDNMKVIAADTEFMGRCRHAYFLLTTDQINSFTVKGDEYTYTVGEWIYYMVANSRRERRDDYENIPISEYFPIANGTAYTYESVKNE